jgi:tRNA-dihydrouridine synthase
VRLVGNGGIDRAEDVHRMIGETGCDGVMVGRAAIANPFLFRECAGRPSPSAAEAAGFVLEYLAAIQPDVDAGHRLGRIKQLVRYYRAGGLFDGREDERAHLLRSKSAAELYRWFERFLEVTV